MRNDVPFQHNITTRTALYRGSFQSVYGTITVFEYLVLLTYVYPQTMDITCR